MILDELYERAVTFHGHSCPGLALGFRMVTEAMLFLDSDCSSDEELAAIAECDFCGVDVLQVVSGCTLGKGNLKILDFGKRAFTLIDRAKGQSCRVIPAPERIRLKREWIDRGKDAWPQWIEHVLHAPPQEIVAVSSCEIPQFERAVIETMAECQSCHEQVTISRVVKNEGNIYCIPCRIQAGNVS